MAGEIDYLYREIIINIITSISLTRDVIAAPKRISCLSGQTAAYR